MRPIIRVKLQHNPARDLLDLIREASIITPEELQDELRSLAKGAETKVWIRESSLTWVTLLR